MGTKKTKLFLAAVLCATVFFQAALSAQSTPPALEELPRHVIDTLDTSDPNVKIVLFTNNTFCYYYPNAKEDLDKSVYSQHWVNNIIFAYRDVKLSDLPDRIELCLINSYDDFCIPIRSKVLSRYGSRGSKPHDGIDLSLTIGEPIYAAFSGKVRYAQKNTGGYGNMVIIRHENGLETWYAHLSRINVVANDYVKVGTVIGYGGATGRVSAPHLHFEVRYCDQSFDPERIFDFQTGAIRDTAFVLEKSYFNRDSRASDTLDERSDSGNQLLVSSSGEQLTSEEVLSNIAAAEKKASSQSSASPDPLYYTIQKGDTLYKIARKYGTTVKKLCQLNNITETTTIHDGKKLRVR